MRDRKKVYLLIGLLVLLGIAYFWNRGSSTTSSGVLASNTQFQPIKVQDPQLRLDLLQKVHTLEYNGTHRNIFNATPPPVIPKPGEPGAPVAGPVFRDQGPHLPPPPPPLTIPATFFGLAMDPRTGNRLAFFQSGDDVFVLGEGSLLLDRYRLLKIGNESAELEEISTKRRAFLPITPPLVGDTGQAPQPTP
jgi:hypothetical protein